MINFWDHMELSTTNPDTFIQRDEDQLQRMDDEDKTGTPWRTFAVDEDEVAIFVELTDKLNQGKQWFAENSKRIALAQQELDKAKAGEYLPRTDFMALVEFLKARKELASDFSPRYQEAKAEAAALLERHGHGPLWASYYRVLEQETRTADINMYFTYGGEDTENAAVDSRHAPTDEIVADTHQVEMSQFDVEFNPNPYLSSDQWNWKEEQACRQQAAVLVSC